MGNLIHKFLYKISVNTKIAVVSGGMLLLMAVSVGFVFQSQAAVETDSNAVDVAGEQRMLTQQIARFAGAIAADPTDQEAREGLEAAVERYENNLQTLKEGGEIDGQSIPAAPDSAQEELQAEREAWDPYKENALTLLEADPDSEEFEDSFAYIQNNADEILVISDDLVVALSAENSQQIAGMQQTLQLFFVMTLGVTLAGYLFTRRYISSPLGDLTEGAKAIQNEQFDTEINRLGAGVANKTDEVAVLGDQFISMRNQLRNRIDEADKMRSNAEQSRAEAQAAKEEAEALNEQFKTTAEEFGAAMDKAANGDLTVRLDSDVDNEALQAIAKETNEMLAGLGRTLGEIDTFIQEVVDASDQIADSTTEVDRASREVSQSVQQISASNTDQHESIEEVADEMTDLSATVEEIASSSAEVAEKSSGAATAGKSGQQDASRTLEQMNAIDEQADATISEVKQLTEEMDRIGEIVDLIDEISNQTNLLALNASIEAARAGEAGEGFGVVADEIKGLAEETNEATQGINEIITDVQDRTETVVADIEEMDDRVDDGKASVQSTVESLEEIVDRVEEANDGVQSINAATDDQAASTEEVSAMMDDISTTSKQTVEEADTVAAAAEQQTASISNVTQEIDTLSDQARDLYEMVDSFRLTETAESSRDHSQHRETNGHDQQRPVVDAEQTASVAPAENGKTASD